MKKSNSVFYALTILLTLFLCSLSFAAPLNQTSSSIAKSKNQSLKASYVFNQQNLIGTTKNPLSMNPEKLTVQSHHFTLEKPLNKRLSFILNLKALRNHVLLSGFGQTIDAQTSGLGDVILKTNFKLSSSWKASLGLSIPTGSYEEKINGHLVSYPGQLGSGTFDGIYSLNFFKHWRNLTHRVSIDSIIRTGKNKLDYRLGNEFKFQASSYFWITRHFAMTGSGYYKSWNKVSGQTNPFDPFAAAGSRWAAYLGLSSMFSIKSWVSAYVDAGVPLVQEEYGPLKGLKSQWFITTALLF
ncbi:MAG: hypothetical protein D6797_08605 [Bdellovibrio sp.]|nr:MAG: hypothetical protein D6797_08605 [Bdellovibrio sp.]